MKEGKISCPKCGGHIAFPPELAGTSVACPHCKSGIVLPANRRGLPRIVILLAILAVSAVALYFFERHLHPPPPLTPFQQLKQLAEKGDPQAMLQLARAYTDGKGVPANPAEGMKWERKAAAAGFPQAMTLVGLTMLDEALVKFQAAHEQDPKDPTTGLSTNYLTMADVPEECLDWLRKAAELGETNAMWVLVDNLNLGAATVDPATGRDITVMSAETLGWLNKLVETGDIRAMVKLGSFYVKSNPGGTNLDAGVALLIRAGDLGNPTAYLTLAQMYKYGDGVPTDTHQAAIYYEKAARKNDLTAQVELAKLYRDNVAVKDLEASFKWFLEAATRHPAQAATYKDIEIAEACDALGRAYDKGLGVAKNEFSSVRWYTEAAKAGLPNGEFHLGLAYDVGEGITRDPQQAMQWYLKAANHPTATPRLTPGLVEAQRNIGYLYKLGQGVDKDPRSAFDWFLKAAHNGSDAAEFEVAKAYAAGVGTLQDGQEAFFWYQVSANRGHMDSQMKLASFYLRQINSRTNASEFRIMAHAWLNLAAAAGYENAADLRNNLVRKMSPVEITEAQRRAKALDDGDSMLTNSLPNLDTAALLESPASAAALADTADLPAFQVVNVTAKPTEENEVWWRYGYRLAVRNNSQSYLGQWFEIQFLDAQGYVIDTVMTQRTPISPGATTIITGDTLVSLPGAARVTGLRAVWKR